MSGAQVVGLGQASAGDDGVGLAVVRHLAETGCAARVVAARDATALIDAMADARHVIVVDAVVVEATDQAGAVMRLHETDLASVQAVSSHAVSVPQAIGLARALGDGAGTRLDVVAIGIARPTGPRSGLSPEVAAAIPKAAGLVRALLAESAPRATEES